MLPVMASQNLQAEVIDLTNDDESPAASDFTSSALRSQAAEVITLGAVDEETVAGASRANPVIEVPDDDAGSDVEVLYSNSRPPSCSTSTTKSSVKDYITSSDLLAGDFATSRKRYSTPTRCIPIIAASNRPAEFSCS